MTDTYIFVEGDTDEKFLQAVFLKYFSDADRAQFLSLGGDFKKLQKGQRNEQLKEGKRNLMIVDADVRNFDEVSSGILTVFDQISKDQKALQIPFFADSFLFPDNKSDGNLESLVRRLTPQEKIGVWDCIDGYASCIAQIQNPKFRSIDSKTKIYIYVNAHDHIKWNTQGWLLDSTIWDLESENIKPLLAFLDKYFTRKP